MKIIVCTDKRGGMMFNFRRQSSDRLVMEDIKKHVGGASVRVSRYSEKLFSESGVRFSSFDNPLDGAGEEDYCFVEDVDITPYEEKIDTVVIYNWNEKYPFDKSFTTDMSKFKKVCSEKFVGYAHDKVIKEVFKR